MSGISIDSQLDEEIKQDAEEIRKILSKHSSSRTNVTISGGRDALRLTIISARIEGEFFGEVRQRFQGVRIECESRTEILITRSR